MEQMSKYERVIHSVLFELFAVLFTLIATKLLTPHSLEELLLVIILISLMALIWNIIFNYFFDRIVTGKRELRSLKVRVIHTISFEVGLLIMTLPLVAFILKISLLEAFLMDLGMTIFVMIYALVFNYIYDHARLKFFAWKNNV